MRQIQLTTLLLIFALMHYRLPEPRDSRLLALLQAVHDRLHASAWLGSCDAPNAKHVFRPLAPVA